MPPSSHQPEPPQGFHYEDALAYLFAESSYSGRAPKYANPERSQERVREILARLGNPHQQYYTLHVTGTKGKGSTSAYAESILRHLGYKTGLFTSPHLHTFRERMRVNGQLIGRQQLADLMARLRPHFDAIPDLSIFDKITALAFQHFADVGVSWAVMEVGLGGRLDSTNVILPAACGITRISKDHMHVLGDTLKQIAFEKAGIIKPGIPVFVSPQHASAKAVISQVAAERNAPLHWVEPLKGFAIPLVGRHQQINAAVAWGMIIEIASRELIEFDETGAAAGLAATRWPGRFELLPEPPNQEPPLLVDCAHNVDSINILLRTLAQFYPERPLIFIFGANRDKLMRPMLERILTATSRLVLVQSRHPKALPAAAILDEIHPWVAQYTGGGSPLQVQVATSVEEAVDLATQSAPPDGLLVGTGSVFVAAELREAWNQRHPGIFPADDWVHEAAREPVLMSPVSGKQG